MNRNKSVGPDDIHPVIIKPLAGIVAGPICKLFGVCIDQGEIQKDWSGAAVVAIHKSDPSSVVGILQASQPHQHSTQGDGEVNPSPYLAEN